MRLSISPFVPRTVLGVLVAVALLTGLRSERLGDRMQIALPLLGLACAAVTGTAADYTVRFAVLWVGIRAGKNGLGDAPINRRPSGGDGGMPSGHTAAATFGASALVHHCLADSPWARAAAIIAGGFTGASRIEAGAHSIWQVLAGVLWGLACDRGLRCPVCRRAIRSGARQGLVAATRHYCAGMTTVWRSRGALRVTA